MFVLIFYKDTGKYFETRNKKTNLSDQFKAEEDPKWTTLECVLFRKSNITGGRIMNCLKNLENEAKELHSLKGKKYLDHTYAIGKKQSSRSQELSL